MIGGKYYSHTSDYSIFNKAIKSLKIDTLFLGDDASTDIKLHQNLRDQGVKWFFVFQTMFNPSYLKEHPEAFAIDSNGEKCRDEWVEFVCPTNKEYLSFLKRRIKQILVEYDPDGLSLDFIRYFVYWEKVYSKDDTHLKRSCFCSSCKEDIRSREEVITDIVKTQLAHLV